jgi:thymidylate synthase
VTTAITGGMTWEEECLPSLQVRNDTGDIALCVLWNLTEKVTPYTPSPEQFARLSVIGNLRTPLGLNWFIRGLWRLSNIQTVAIWGNDLANTGQAILRLWQKGISDDFRVPDFGWHLDEHIVPTASTIEDIRKLVHLCNIRGTAIRNLPEVLASLPEMHVSREPKDFPPVPVPSRQILPSRGSTVIIHATNPADGWIRALGFVMQCGHVRVTRKREKIAHYFNILATMPVLYEHEEVASCFGTTHASPFDFSLADFETYYQSFISSSKLEGVEYGYGERAQNWRGHNQVEEVIQRLQDAPDTKRATIVFLESPDLSELEDAPCLTHTTYSIMEGELHSTAVYRSHDIYEGWPFNVLALLRLHRYIVQRLSDQGIGLGTFTVLSENAQIYERHWDRALKQVEAHSHMTLKHMPAVHYNDPAGNFIFSVRDRTVRAMLTNPTGDEVIWQVEHKSPNHLMRWIVDTMPHLHRDHFLYLGQEMEKLRRALEEGVPYVQG